VIIIIIIEEEVKNEKEKKLISTLNINIYIYNIFFPIIQILTSMATTFINFNNFTLISNNNYIYFCTSSEPMTRMKVASVRLATARAHKVLPVPGGPYNKTPFGGSIPRLINLSGYLNINYNK